MSKISLTRGEIAELWVLVNHLEIETTQKYIKETEGKERQFSRRLKVLEGLKEKLKSTY